MDNMVEKAMPLKGDYSGSHYQRYRDAESADDYDRNRALLNLNLYMPTSAWAMFPGEIRQQFREQGRKPSKYNLIPNYVDGHTGMLISSNAVDPKFVDNEADDLDTTQTLQAMQKAYYADKNLFNYQKSHNAAVLNGCIYRGVEELRISRSFMDPLGRPYFESISPTSVIFDPTAVHTDDLGMESKECWKRFYLYPREIMEMYPEQAENVNGYLSRQSNFSQSTSYVDVPDELVWQNKYMVVEWYNIVTEVVEVAVEKEFMLTLPNKKGVKFGSEEDFVYKKDFFQRERGIELNPANISVRKKKKDALYVTTFAPGLSITLQNKRDERQVRKPDGSTRLPYFVWAFSQKNGKTSGVVDTIADAQEDINKREAARTKFITQTPQQKIIVHPDAYGDDMAKREELTKNLNDPATPFYLDEGAPVGVPLITNINGVQLPPALFQDEQFKIQLMDRMSAFNQAMQGLEGKSGESGVLFSRKVIEGNTLNKTRADRLQDYQMQKFEAWFQMARKLYGGDSEDERKVNLDRTFVDGKGGKTVLNKVEGYTPFGDPVISNDVSKLKRVNVIISETKENDYMKQMKREINIALSQALGPTTPQNMGYKAILDAALVGSIDDISPEQKSELEEMSNLSVESAKKQLMVNNANLDMQLQQINGMMQSQGTEQMMGGGGIPPEQINAQASVQENVA